MNLKVCILAAGIGSRMDPYTQNINKSLLPVNFKAVISHIIEKFDCNTDFIIAVGYLKEIVIEYLECAHKNRKITYVDVDKYMGKGSGPGYSLLQCRNYINQPFIFSTADTLVMEDIPPPTENWLGVSPVVRTENYCTAKIDNDLITRLDDKVLSTNKNAFIGIAGVKDYKVFFEALSKNNELSDNEFQVINGFSSLIEYDLRPKIFSWHDTGNLEGYFNANKKISKSDKQFDFSKSNEFLYFVENNVIKYFKDKSILKNRYKRSKILKGLCPEIHFIKNYFYAYNKVEGKVLYDIIDENIMKKFINWLDEKVWLKKKISDIETKSFVKACYRFYYHKSLDRISSYQKKHNIDDKPTKINGIKIPSVRNLLDQINWDYISNGIPSIFHGDLHFDNILMTNSGKFLILDWRQDFSGIIEYGDMYYDLAKLNGGMIVDYKSIKDNKFTFKNNKEGIVIEHDITNNLINSKNIFTNYLNSEKLDITKINILTGLIFLNMSPMHNEPFDHFIYNLGKLTLYQALLNEYNTASYHNHHFKSYENLG